MKMKSCKAHAKQAGDIQHYICSVSNNEHNYKVQDTPVYIVISAHAKSMWIQRGFHRGLIGVLTVIKSGLWGVLSWFDYTMFVVPRVV